MRSASWKKSASPGHRVQKQLTEGLGAVDRSTDGCLGWKTRHPVLDPSWPYEGPNCLLLHVPYVRYIKVLGSLMFIKKVRFWWWSICQVIILHHVLSFASASCTPGAVDLPPPTPAMTTLAIRDFPWLLRWFWQFQNLFTGFVWPSDPKIWWFMMIFLTI